ncbi:class I SAM-dependent methyltransferase [Litoreibacter roseus]|uniref:Methyltransferase domain-containing protein n=1 Tax=Litoreibacter roseus TaxID=2601869 RepID=A0A6N6JD32_9RHOB|nr:class I SAM-dependent methyltransferase [Litoreibacter roseus]GFE64065.1 hypothetical protein KIN_11390 [Litoreibacter roseus]
MDIAGTYDRAAPRWGKQVARLGYGTAYEDFLSGHTIPDGPVLDVGTGDGIFARSWIAQNGSTDFTLLDPSAAMLEHARNQFARSGLCPRLVNSSLEGFDPDNGFCAILAAHVFEHFADPWTALSILARGLRPSGKLFLVISKPHWCNWLIWIRFRHRWFAPEQIVHMALDAGLTHQMTHDFKCGPPSRTSLGYIFTKP